MPHQSPNPHRDRDVTQSDPRWPVDLRLLIGRRSGEILSTVVDEAGGRLVAHRPKQVNHQPGRSTTVQYEVTVGWPDGGRSRETLVAMTGSRLPPGAVMLERDGCAVAVWRWRDDPALPGLDAALDPRRVTEVVDDLGIRTPTDPPVQMTTRAYRPGRRAVVEVRVGDRSLYLKVVRPRMVQSLHTTHRRLSEVLPSPDSLGWSSDGILVLPGLPGETLRARLRRDDDGAPGDGAPDPALITALLDRIPAERDGRVDADHPVVAVRHHARTLAAVAPSLRPLVERTLERVEVAAARHPHDHPLVGVHGDLYEAQLLVHGPRICGILDLDTVRSGHRIDDLANFCAHLSVLATTATGPARRSINVYGSALLAHAETTFDRADLRARVAAYVIGLATGPFRVLEPGWQAATQRRLELAGTWLLDERLLIGRSSPAHPPAAR